MGVIPADAPVTVEGCLDQSSWCKVSHDGRHGWASGNYLTTRAALVPTGQQMAYKTVTYDKTEDADAFAGAAAGAMVGAMVAGPLGAAVGGIIGIGAGVGVGALDDTVVTYVRANPVEQIYVDGEVVVGAGLPDTVRLVPVPGSEYSYVYVNGVPVVVEPKGRRIIHIVR